MEENSNTFNIQEDNSFYPPKPRVQDAEQGNVWVRSAISMLLYIGIGYMAFNRDLVAVLIIVAIIFLHEMGHFVAMRLFNYSDVKMFFIPLMGAFVSGKETTVSQKQKAIVILAGPLPGIIIGSALLSYALANPAIPHLQMVVSTLLFLNCFNLLPISPFDGGQLLETMFITRNKTLQVIFLAISVGVLLLIAFYAKSIVLGIIAVLVLLRIRGIYNLSALRKILFDKNIDYEKTYEQLTNEEYWLIRDEIIENDKAYSNFERRNFDAREAVMIQAVNNTLQIPMQQDLGVIGKLLIVLVWILSFAVPLLIAGWYYATH